MPAKTECPLTAKQFTDIAQPITARIDDVPHIAQVKEFSTGSFGWYLSGKTTIVVGGKPVQVQIGMHLTVIGSKDAPR